MIYDPPTMIQMDIGGHPPIPLAQNNCPFWQFPTNVSKVYWVPNLWSHFKALNDVFWRFRGETIFNGMYSALVTICKAHIYISNGLSSAQIRYHIKKL